MARVDGVDYTPEGIESVRAGVIELRDAALVQNNYEWAVLLSHTLAYLSEYKEAIEDGSIG